MFILEKIKAQKELVILDDPKVSMKRKLRKCALDEKYLEKVLQIS